MQSWRLKPSSHPGPWDGRQNETEARIPTLWSRHPRFQPPVKASTQVMALCILFKLCRFVSFCCSSETRDLIAEPPEHRSLWPTAFEEQAGYTCWGFNVRKKLSCFNKQCWSLLNWYTKRKEKTSFLRVRWGQHHISCMTAVESKCDKKYCVEVTAKWWSQNPPNSTPP